jgi:hypothetical protein
VEENLITLKGKAIEICGFHHSIEDSWGHIPMREKWFSKLS